MATPATQEGILRNTHLLVVDDEENLRLSLSLVCRKAGYRVSLARDAHEALQMISLAANGPDRIDLLVVDIQMPGMSGIELCKRLEKHHRKLPVIIISGYRYREVIKNLHSDSEIYYLEKPFQPEEFLEHVDRAIRSIREDISSGYVRDADVFEEGGQS